MATLRELGAQETSLAYPALLELRPHLESLDAFMRQINKDQRAEGYLIRVCIATMLIACM